MGEFKVIKSFTKKWSSGVTTVAVVSDREHQERNYLILKRGLLGKPDEKQQFFYLRLEDWENLKKVVEGEATPQHQWKFEDIGGAKAGILKILPEVLEKDPDFLATILSKENIRNLTDASFEALDDLGLRVYEIKAETVEFLLKKLASSKGEEIENFAEILEKLRIGQVSAITELVRKKLAIIELLETLLQEAGTKEKEIHVLLENNLWLLNNDYDLVKSNTPLSAFLSTTIKEDPELGKRPDLIVKVFLQDPNHVVIVELKRPTVKLHPKHVGQALEYKGIVESHNPDLSVDLFLLGYDLDKAMPRDLEDINVDLLENVVSRKRREFNEFLEIVEEESGIEF